MIAIKRLLLIPDRIRRQGFVGALSGLAPVAVAGVATAGVFRNEIADIVEDLASNYSCIRLKTMFVTILLSTQILFNLVLLIFSLSLCDILDPTTTTTTAATTTTSKLILSKSTIHVQPNIINIILIQMLAHFTHSLLDPCKGVTCATGKKAVASLGICQCLEVKFIMENVPFQIFIVR